MNYESPRAHTQIPSTESIVEPNKLPNTMNRSFCITGLPRFYCWPFGLHTHTGERTSLQMAWIPFVWHSPQIDLLLAAHMKAHADYMTCKLLVTTFKQFSLARLLRTRVRTPRQNEWKVERRKRKTGWEWKNRGQTKWEQTGVRTKWTTEWKRVCST